MSTFDEWLRIIGFSRGNPFASKVADQEDYTLLGDYFFEHRAYASVLNSGLSESCLLHAPRGAGKTATRRMFARRVLSRFQQARPLLVELCDWATVVELAGSAAAVSLKDHILPALYDQAVLALAQSEPPRLLPADTHHQQYLHWLCATHGRGLTPALRERVALRRWIPWPGAPPSPDYALSVMTLRRQMETLIGVVCSLGFSGCYVVLDGVDETAGHTADWAAGAAILAQLLGQHALLKLPDLAFKCFVPSEIFQLLKQGGSVRLDLLSVYELVWSVDELNALLSERLLVYSDNSIPRLAGIAHREVRDQIDRRLCELAAGSPRRLIALGNQLLQSWAATATPEEPYITAAHLAELPPSAPPPKPLPPLPGTDLPTSAVPPLHWRPNGKLYRGHEEISDSDKTITPLQRRALELLFAQPGKLVSDTRLAQDVYELGELVGPDDKERLRKLFSRLIRLIEPDEKNPVYIKRLSGGYRLDNAE